MPIYDYVCKACGFEFEKLLLVCDKKPSCPRCKSCDLEKHVSVFSCTTVNLNKRLKMESEEQMKKGNEMIKKEKFRKNRIKIL